MTIHFLAPEDKKKWPPIWHKCFKSWTKTKYDLNIWTDEGIDKLLQEDDNEFYEQYLNYLDPIYKYDYIRYIILKKYGGVYVDMDVELIRDFFPLLNPNIIYLMEGTGGTYVENSLMISPTQDYTKTHEEKTHNERVYYEKWDRIQNKSKTNIMQQFDKIKDNKKLVLDLVGPNMLSTYFAKERNNWNKPWYDILGYYQFGNINSTLSFTKHYYSGTWCRMTEDVKKQLIK